MNVIQICYYFISLFSHCSKRTGAGLFFLYGKSIWSYYVQHGLLVFYLTIENTQCEERTVRWVNPTQEKKWRSCEAANMGGWQAGRCGHLNTVAVYVLLILISVFTATDARFKGKFYIVTHHLIKFAHIYLFNITYLTLNQK